MANKEKAGDAPETVEKPALKLLGKDDILGADDLKYEVVDVPEWGGQVRVKSMTASERDSYEEACITGKGKDRHFALADVRAKLCARCIVDGEGKRIFSDAEIALLGRKSAAALDRVFGVASKLSKLSKEDIDELAGELKNDHSGEPS